jgi:hypothetical protein
VVVLVVCRALWRFAQVAIKLTLSEVPPLLQAAARSAGAGLLLGLCRGPLGRRRWRCARAP